MNLILRIYAHESKDYLNQFSKQIPKLASAEKCSHGVFVRKRDADVVLLSPKIISFGISYPTGKVLIVNAMKTH